jgi:hypothetical protein
VPTRDGVINQATMRSALHAHHIRAARGAPVTP